LTNLLNSIGSITNILSLAEADPALAEKTRILGFDLQTLIQIGFQGLAALILFFFLSKLLFKPVRDILEKRHTEIETTLDKIEADNKAATELIAEYDGKIKNIKIEADKILTHAHKKAIAREDEIVKEAHEEAIKIMQRAHLDIEREKVQVKDEIRQEIIEVATIMAAKYVEVTLSEEQQKVLINETIDEMGDDTWLN
jgi:F-type H+-transporting ATPase subunit b